MASKTNMITCPECRGTGRVEREPAEGPQATDFLRWLESRPGEYRIEFDDYGTRRLLTWQERQDLLDRFLELEGTPLPDHLFGRWETGAGYFTAWLAREPGEYRITFDDFGTRRALDNHEIDTLLNRLDHELE